MVPAGGRAVLARDRAELLAAVPGLDPARVLTLAPWPALHDRDDARGVADSLVLRDADGLLLDVLTYSAAGVPSGVTLEWWPGGWFPAAGAPGTPLEPPHVVAERDASLRVAPHRLHAPGELLRIAWSLPWPLAHVTVAVHDLAGHRAALWLDDVVAGREEERMVRADVPAPGVYLVTMRARGPARELVRVQALRIDGGTR